MRSSPFRNRRIIEVARKGSDALARQYWSTHVTEHSHALTLESGVFTKHSPRVIAESLKRSAERSRRRKGTPFQSAMSMLNFYVNRMGRNLRPGRRRILERAKSELRNLFGKRKTKARPDQGDNHAG